MHPNDPRATRIGELIDEITKATKKTVEVRYEVVHGADGPRDYATLSIGNEIEIDEPVDEVLAFVRGYFEATVPVWSIRIGLGPAEAIWENRRTGVLYLAVEPDEPGGVVLPLDAGSSDEEIRAAYDEHEAEVEEEERFEASVEIAHDLSDDERKILGYYAESARSEKDFCCRYGHADCSTRVEGPCSNELFANAYAVVERHDAASDYDDPAFLDEVVEAVETLADAEKADAKVEVESAGTVREGRVEREYLRIPDERLGIAEGDRVRSYDFVVDEMADAGSYAEGIVEEIAIFPQPHLCGCRRYRIRVERRVFGREEVEVRDHEREVFPPVNGTKILGGGESRYVERIKNREAIEEEEGLEALRESIRDDARYE